MYLVTGATGNVGSNVVKQLLDMGKQVRVFVRDSAKVSHWGNRVEVAVGEYGKAESFAKAISGVDGAFLVNRGADSESFSQLLTSAKEQGDPRIVFLSSLLAGDPALKIGQMHKEQEDAIRESRLRSTFLRPGAFMSNAFQWLWSVKAEGIVYNPMSGGKTAPIAVEDIAAVAVKALTKHDTAELVHELTGAEFLSTPEQVAILAEALNRPLRCVDVPIDAAVQGLVKSGIPEAMAAAVAESFQAIREGRTVTVTDTVERVTGNKPKTFAQWANENSARFA